jgi:hypothetical protein
MSATTAARLLSAPLCSGTLGPLNCAELPGVGRQLGDGRVLLD